MENDMLDTLCNSKKGTIQVIRKCAPVGSIRRMVGINRCLRVIVSESNRVLRGKSVPVYYHNERNKPTFA